MPISLACRSPGTVPNSKCTLLVAEGKSLENAPAPPSATPSVLPPAPPVDQDEDQSEDSAEMDNEQGVYEQTQDMEYAYPESKDMHEIFRFIAGMRAKRFISKEDANNLEANVIEGYGILFAAYQVAVNAKDPNYFAEICKDIASSLDSEDGRTTVEAQDEVLKVVDQLYQFKRISAAQLLYLRHLVLIRDESVAKIYDDFQDTDGEDVQGLAKNLYILAAVGPAAYNQENEKDESDKSKESNDDDDDEDDDEDDDDDDDEILGKSYFSPQGAVKMKERMKAVVGHMYNNDLVSTDEANILLEKVDDEDEYIVAAYEVWKSDASPGGVGGHPYAVCQVRNPEKIGCQ